MREKRYFWWAGYNVSLPKFRDQIVSHRPFVMARALDAGSGDAFTGRTSELRGKEKDPQPDRVRVKQGVSSQSHLCPQVV